MRRLEAAVIAAALGGWLAAPAPAAPPEKITFQGRLTDADGQPVTGSVNLTFNIYDGGGPVWTETQTGVVVTGGGYSVQLGDVTSLGSLDFDESYTLGIEVDSDPEMSPRFALGASPYAFRAKSAINSDTVTNGVYTTGSYADPAWLTSLVGTKITGNIPGNAANVTGVVAIANGGTGTSSQSFVDMTTTQSVGGNKTFTGNVTFTGTISSNVSATTDNNRTLGTSLYRWQKGYFGPSSVHIIATDEETGGIGPREWTLGIQDKGGKQPGTFRLGETVGELDAMNITPGGRVGVGTDDPGDRLDVRGRIKLGDSGQLFAVGGTENLRTIRGIVGMDGKPVAGADVGYLSERLGPGHYRVIYNASFLDLAVPAVTPILNEMNTVRAAAIVVFDKASFEVQISDGSNPVDCAFTFVVVGPY